MAPSTANMRTRDFTVLVCMTLLLFFWVFPITALASLLSYKEIKTALPWLGKLIDKNDKIRAIVQNSLPSVAMIALNALLPFMLEGNISFHQADSVFTHSVYQHSRMFRAIVLGVG